MRRFFVDKIDNQKLVVSGDQFLHMTKVLRMREGDSFLAICGDSKEYECRIAEISSGRAICEVVSERLVSTDAEANVAVFQACVKGDKFDLIIQKLSELGIRRLVPFDSEFSIAKCQADKTPRYNKIATEACKQCRRTVPMEVSAPMKFSGMLEEIKKYDMVVFCNEHETSRPLRTLFEGFLGSVAIIVGSEGGFSPNEITKLQNAGACSITLGKRILRAETAAIVTAGCVMMLLGEMD